MGCQKMYGRTLVLYRGVFHKAARGCKKGRPIGVMYLSSSLRSKTSPFNPQLSLSYPGPDVIARDLRVLVSFPLLIAAVTEDTLCVGVARVGADDQQIVAAPLKQLATRDLGPPLHSLVVTGHMHPLEIDMLKLFADDHSVFPLSS